MELEVIRNGDEMALLSVNVPIDSRAESAIMDANNLIRDGTLTLSFVFKKCGSETPMI